MARYLTALLVAAGLAGCAPELPDDYLWTSDTYGISVYGMDWEACGTDWPDTWREELEPALDDFAASAGFDRAAWARAIAGVDLVVREAPFSTSGLQDLYGVVLGTRVDVVCSPHPATYQVLVHEMTHLYLRELTGDADADHVAGPGPWTPEVSAAILRWVSARPESWVYQAEHGAFGPVVDSGSGGR